MAAEIHQSVARRAAILRLIRESTVHNQDELVRLLRKQGFEATQSSVSRDLRELGVPRPATATCCRTPSTRRAADKFAAVASFVRRSAHRRSVAHRGQDHHRLGAERRGRHRQGRLARSRRHGLRRRHDLHRHRRRARAAQLLERLRSIFASLRSMTMTLSRLPTRLRAHRARLLRRPRHLVPGAVAQGELRPPDHHGHRRHRRHRRRGARRSRSARRRSAPSSTTSSTRARTTSSRCCAS